MFHNNNGLARCFMNKYAPNPIIKRNPPYWMTNNRNYLSWRCICKIKLLVKAAWRWYHFHRQLSGLSPCLKFVIGRALTILSWDNPVTAFFRKSRKLRHSLGRPSRSDFVQYEFVLCFSNFHPIIPNYRYHIRIKSIFDRLLYLTAN